MQLHILQPLEKQRVILIMITQKAWKIRTALIKIRTAWKIWRLKYDYRIIIYKGRIGTYPGDVTHAFVNFNLLSSIHVDELNYLLHFWQSVHDANRAQKRPVEMCHQTERAPQTTLLIRFGEIGRDQKLARTLHSL